MIARYLRRLARSHAVLLTCLLLGVSMVAASQISEHSSEAVRATVSENWRGDYDLLVAPPGGLTEAAAETGGLIEQNFASLAADSHISEADLEQVAQVSGVEVAAPLAFIGQFASPALEVPVGAVVEDWQNSEFFEHVRIFTGSISTFYDDGMQLQHLLSSPPETLFLTGLEEIEVPQSLIDSGQYSEEDVPVDGPPEMLMFDIALHQCEDCEQDTWSEAQVERSVDADETAVVYETFEVVPELYSTMVAIDPTAERDLLGDAGVFLDSLIEFEQVRSNVGEGPCDGEPTEDRQYGECLADLIDPDRFQHIHERAFYGNTEEPAIDGESSDGPRPEAGEQLGPVIPIIYSDAEYPELFAEAAFPQRAVFEDTEREEVFGDDRFQEALYEDPSDYEAEVIDLSENLVPFIPQLDLSFGLDGADAPQRSQAAETTQIAPDWTPGRVERSEPDPGLLHTAPDGVEVQLVNEPQGYHALDAELTSREARYRPWERNPVDTPRPPEGTLLAPVDSYTPGEVLDEDTASYVPLGLYAEAESTIVEPGEHQGRNLPPSFSGRGALMNSPGALTTLDAYSSYHDELQADVIRVRAEGVDDYSAENLSTIEDLALQIEDLGLDVRVVAGSSLAPVGVYLPEFYDDGTDLGWTVEEWTSLGAALQTEQAQTTASWILLMVSLAGVTLLACAVQLTAIRPRRAEAALLTSMGWTRSRIRRWFLTEDLPALVLVAAATAVALLLAASPVAQATTAVAGPAFLVAVCLVAVAATPKRPPRPRRSDATGPALPARSPTTIGRRLARASRLATTLSGLALVVLVTTALTFVTVILTSRDQAGPTRIANLVNAEVLLPQTILAAGALTAGTIMFVMGIRRTLHQAADQHHMLLTLGWGRKHLSSCIRAQLLSSLLPGVVISGLIGVIALTTLNINALGAPIAVIIGIPALGVTIALTWSARHAHRSSPEHATAHAEP